MRHSLMIAGFLALAAVEASAEDKPILTVYTYDSFVAEWGPGPAIETAFEATCACDLVFVAPGDAAAMLSRLLLEGAGTPADVVLGLDTSLMKRAADSGLLAPHGAVQAAYDLPVAWDDPVFVPFDWGHFAFVYDTTRLATPPRDFRELAQSDVSVVIEDPRSSSPGLGLLMWVRAAYGDEAPGIWTSLADNIVSVTPGWSEAYGLFLQGEADMVLSYTTSPAYHIQAEGDLTKAAAPFAEGHYLQVEVGAAVAGSDQPELAQSFLSFSTGPEFQGAIPRTNWMYPAVALPDGLPPEFEALVRPERTLLLDPAESEALREKAIEEWRTALSQ